jgi:hypothetical protein
MAMNPAQSNRIALGAWFETVALDIKVHPLEKGTRGEFLKVAF